MKISLIFCAALLSLKSIEISLLSLHLAGFSLFWLSVTGLAFSVLSLSFWCFFAEGLYRLVGRWPRIKNWLSKEHAKENRWITKCQRYHYWGMFFGGFVPFIGIPAQKILRLRYGYIALFAGNAAKAELIVGLIGISNLLK